MFSFLKEKLKSVYKKFSTQLNALFSRTAIDEHYFDELYTLLIESDVGVSTTKHLIADLKEKFNNNTIQSGTDVKTALEHSLLHMLNQHIFNTPHDGVRIIMLVGINGSGKTTAAAKIAHYYAQHKVLLIAADTFRAAAPDQLASWATTTGVDIYQGTTGEDPSAVIYKGCAYAKQQGHSVIIIDTAGRLQTKEPLMKELNKMQRTAQKVIPHASLTNLLVVDAMLGQNSLAQAHVFNQATPLDGVILTKLDGTAKGGIIFAIQKELNLAIAYLSMGEKLEDFKAFNAQEYLELFFQDHKAS